MELAQEYVADDLKKAMFLYDSALKQVSTKIEILSEEFVNVHNYNPIEHVKTRIKTSESITHKLEKQGYDTTIENMMHYLHDVAGVRIICSFEKDIYSIADMICNQDDVKVLIIKNYIANPKPNGYKSYHLVVSVPIYLSEGPVETKVEIQIRTVAMDFWASLEHKIKYKFEGNAPDRIQLDLKECADIVDMLDKKMFSLNEEIKAFAGGLPMAPSERDWKD
ncbi:MAG: GTP pyrophosphokinase family protein [Lachnospiraceae bacterium]|nr:GTP pyrophosphokinase family protein [Lachnospiraceae bacterium]